MGNDWRGQNKTDTTGFFWAQHLATLLIDSVYTASKAWNELATNKLDQPLYEAFIANFKELYESTKTYMPPKDLEALNVPVCFNLYKEQNGGQIERENLFKTLETFFSYNELLHKSNIMKVIMKPVDVYPG